MASGGDGDVTECALDVNGPVCADEDALRIVAKFVKKETGVSSESPFIIVETAKKITKCKTEECALLAVANKIPTESEVIHNTIKNNIKLDGPADSQALLHNENIDSILDQMCARHTKMLHLPYHMINFDERNTPMKKINLLTDVIEKDYTTMCVVLNTDVYGNKGIHWFCIFCDFRSTGSSNNPFTIEYFNSSGNKPGITVTDWMARNKYAIEENKKYNCRIVHTSKFRHQYDTETECGVYCLYYIHKRINGTNIDYFNDRIADSDMIDFRKLLFRNRKTDPAN